ncbi:MAG: MmgE/PrpD family protein [Betaproteobacteria bacterium]|nr:MAG: MmgE/PrpD family protein [Betaproteobacteria bacterium]
MGHTATLARYASKLRYEELPPDVVQIAKNSIADTFAIMAFGAALPWSRIIAGYATENGPGGKSRILGTGAAARPPAAAFANGAFAHAFEMDNLTKPNSGSHPGATVLSAALALAQDRGIGGRELLTAFVAGAEVMIRIGQATRHSNEKHGYHAPGTTGPFGAAAGASRLLALDAERTCNALGIAASTAAGILEFAKSGSGAMVKRLHLGRAGESGVLAASLAERGFTAPASALEGEFGFIKVFCREYDMDALTRGLGETYVSRTILTKRYACHITAHTAVDSAIALREQHHFGAQDVASMTIAGTERMLRVNNIARPKDLMMSQYSIPYCVALAMFHNPMDPSVFNDEAARDPRILDLAGRVKMFLAPPPDHQGDLTTTLTVQLKDGRTLSRRATHFKGTPDEPLAAEELRTKFLLVTKRFGAAKMSQLFDRIQNLEAEASLDWLGG